MSEGDQESSEKPKGVLRKITSLFHSDTGDAETQAEQDSTTEAEKKQLSPAVLRLKKIIGPSSDPNTAHIPYTSEKLNKNGFRVINGKVQTPKKRGSI
ncbi:MAG: hypothetical protein ACHQUA_02100 [Microgenomates group bacterium]